MGYRLEGSVGDAVIIEAIEPSVQLDHYFTEFCAATRSPIAGRSPGKSVKSSGNWRKPDSGTKIFTWAIFCSATARSTCSMDMPCGLGG